MSAEVPHALIAALDNASASTESSGPEPIKIRVVRAGETVPEPPTGSGDDARVEAYCEFFRRELADVHTLEDWLSQLGGPDV